MFSMHKPFHIRRKKMYASISIYLNFKNIIQQYDVVLRYVTFCIFILFFMEKRRRERKEKNETLIELQKWFRTQISLISIFLVRDTFFKKINKKNCGNTYTDQDYHIDTSAMK